MQKEFVEMFAKSTESSLEAARKLSELNMRTFELLMQQQASMFGAYLDLTTKSIEVASKAKGVQELIEGQSQLGREFSERSMEAMRKGMTSVNESGAEYSNLMQENLRAVQAQAAAAAETVRKAA